MPGRDRVLFAGLMVRHIAHGLPASLFQQPSLHRYPNKVDHCAEGRHQDRSYLPIAQANAAVSDVAISSPPIVFPT